MIQKLRKVFALAASAALVLGLAACSGAEKPRTSTESSAESVQPPPVPGPGTPPPVPGPAVPPGGSGAKSPNSDLRERKTLPPEGLESLMGKDEQDYVKIMEEGFNEMTAATENIKSPDELSKAIVEVDKRITAKLKEACRTGNNFVCDAMVSSVVADLEEWTFYATCGGRSPSPIDGKCREMKVK